MISVPLLKRAVMFEKWRIRTVSKLLKTLKSRLSSYFLKRKVICWLETLLESLELSTLEREFNFYSINFFNLWLWTFHFLMFLKHRESYFLFITFLLVPISVDILSVLFKELNLTFRLSKQNINIYSVLLHYDKNKFIQFILRKFSSYWKFFSSFQGERNTSNESRLTVN